MKKVLFIDRDGTLIMEAPPTYQLDAFEKLQFYPHMFEYMRRIAQELDYELVMVTNQDGLGTDSFPENTFWPLHELVMKSLEGEGIHFSKVFIDRTFPEENKPTRKPGTGMLTEYQNNPDYDLVNSYVIGDRITDIQLAKNLGCKGIWLNLDPSLGQGEIKDKAEELRGSTVALETTEWSEIYAFLKLGTRQGVHERNTSETKIRIDMNLEGSGRSSISTGIGFFDHMLDQVA
ncbi:MAG: histidinol-phosphatase, partial [Chitinophagaceae bacterium]|nr:histidinol-phosphatase [Chitinophagaceae bacterium]